MCEMRCSLTKAPEVFPALVVYNEVPCSLGTFLHFLSKIVL